MDDLHTPARSDVMRLRQRSMWHGFDYELLSPSGSVLGGLSLPTFSQAKNARLAVHPPGSSKGDVQIRLQGQTWLLRHEHTRRGFTNDLRYTLESPAHDVLCSAEVTFESGRRLPVIRLTAPMHAEVMPSTSAWRKRFPIVDASGSALGEIFEPRLFALKLELGLRLPAASLPLQAFVLAVALFVRR
ncbi:MAG: hypothetical protein K0M70_08490 [Arenimonas sp.]|uniref:hypothetical protein n=1 Tax=Arenimonas sp. TaxID=1872635 RepID=UPI0025C12003|nr:hypothetical protein [Arenimonas sp.]MBW8367881.1 hypothetical protein [Arenimonas sp.]